MRINCKPSLSMKEGTGNLDRMIGRFKKGFAGKIPAERIGSFSLLKVY